MGDGGGVEKTTTKNFQFQFEICKPQGGGSWFYKNVWIINYSQTQSGIKYFTSWKLILSAKNFARNSGSRMRQKTFKIVVIWVFPWQEISSCNKKFLTVAWNSFLWKEVSFCNKKFLLVERNFFLWQEISSCDKKLLPLERDFFLSQEISSCGNRLIAVPKCFFLWQANISFVHFPYFHTKVRKSYITWTLPINWWTDQKLDLWIKSLINSRACHHYLFWNFFIGTSFFWCLFMYIIQGKK